MNVLTLIGRCFLISLFCLSTAVVYSGTNPPLIKVLDGSRNQVRKDSFVVIQNAVFFDTGYAGKIDTPYMVKNAVTLKLNEAAALYLKGPFSVTVTIRIIYTNSSLAVDSVDKNLTINYDTVGHYNSRNSFVFTGGQRVNVKILNITSSDGEDISPALMIENELQAFPAYRFSCTDNTIQSINYTIPIVSNPDELAISWPNSMGADVYDLEWTYIDSSALANHVYGDPVHPDPILLFSNNATRISTSGLFYSIPLIYDNTGTLFFRVRAVQEKTGDIRTEANWSSDYPAAGLGQFSFKGHERNFNWQSTATFAEDGKRKIVVQYYDGSLRSRQTVTKDNTTNTTVVAETFYDYQGRPSIQVLPSPTLNTIIGYSQGFNRGLNGGEYDRTNYDTLSSSVTFCNAGALAMDTSGGASNYYSPANTQKDIGFNKFIPDAKGYPFTETEYTQDNTGRIRRQSGAGPDHRLGSGHETMYYYGSPDQAELDALFGTEAGDKNHYFKNMVRDANGQYSVSYVDMHGRTIATALAGSAPAGVQLDALNSNTTSTITETLADPGSAVIKDLVMESKKSLLVATAGLHNFSYSLSPKTLKEQDCALDSLCYHCLYNLEIIITDDCNNQKLPGGKTFDTTISNFAPGAIDTGCNTPAQGFLVNFSLNLPEGNYEVTKKLTVDRDALQYYRDSVFISRNTCTTINQFIQQQRGLQINNQCQPDCQSCKDSLGSWDSFRTRYMQLAGIGLGDTAANRGNALAAYQDALAACTALCDNSADNDDIRTALLLDMTAPSGQYANPDNTQDIYSIFYSPSHTQGYTPVYKNSSIHYPDANGQADLVFNDSTGTYVSPQQLDAFQFSAKFKSSWASVLLAFHPEYCKLAEYEKHNASNLWDRQFIKVNDYATALSMGYFNPTANSSAPFNKYPAVMVNKDPLAMENSSNQSQLESKLQNYNQYNGITLSMWSAATLLTECSGTDVACANRFKSNDSAFSNNICTADLDMAWRTFRQLYSEAKKTIVNNLINNTSCSNTNYNITAQTLSAAGHQPNFNSATGALAQNGLGNLNTLTDTAAARATGQDAMANYFSATCSSYVKLWVQQLAPCNYPADSLNNVIIPQLLKVCIKGADAAHPQGSSSISPDSSYIYQSFTDVINAYNHRHGITDAFHCNADLITAPKPYNQQAVYSNKPLWSKPSDCECSTINTLYQEYTRYGSQDATFAAFLLRTRNTKMNDADLTQLRNMCNGTLICHYLPAPISLPPLLQCNASSVCTTCIEVDSLYNLYQLSYPGNTPVKAPADTVQQQKNILFANFMNNRLGFSKQAWEYIDFKTQCDSIYVAGRDTTSHCTDVFAASYQPYSISTCYSSSRNPAYSVEGAFVYSSLLDSTGVEIDDTTGFWRNDPLGTNPGDITDGRLNRVGIWVCDSTNGAPYNRWQGFTVPVYIPSSDTVYIGMAGDNKIKVSIDGTVIKTLDQYPWHVSGGFTQNDASPFLRWYLFPVRVTRGYHNFTFEGWNDANVASFGAEIYNTSRAQLLTADSNTIKSHTLFSTTQVAQHQTFNTGHGCPSGYTLDSTGGIFTCSKAVPCTCLDIIPPSYQTVTLSSCFSDVKDAAYSVDGAFIYSSVQDTTGEKIPDTNSFWSNTTNGTTDGYLNRVGIWPCSSNSTPLQQWIGFTVPVSIPANGTYYIGMASDNQLKVTVDGILFKEIDQQAWRALNGDKTRDANPFLRWHIYPVSLMKGYHNFTVEAWNTALNGSFGAEIYNASKNQLLGADSSSIKNLLLFSTTQVAQHQTFNAGYGCPAGYDLDSTGGNYTCRIPVSCNSLSYNGLHLCGKSDPILPAVAIDSITNCSDSSFFSVSKGTELFKVYSDSVKGGFESDYRNTCLQAYKYENFTVTHTASEYHYTLYYYDQAGNLLKTVPPQGVVLKRSQGWLDSVRTARTNAVDLSNTSHTLVTQYRYNTLNQVIAQNTPDAGNSRFWYDRLGRLSISQNAKQAALSDYSYTLYDSTGRITEVGQINNVQAMDDSISRKTDRLLAWLATTAGTKNQITQTVYDMGYHPIDSVGLFHQVNLRNRVAYTSFYKTQAQLYPGGQLAATYYSYDIHGNVDTLLQDYKGLSAMSMANRFKRIVYQYDLVSGKVNHVAYQPSQTDAFYNRYSYDAENRLTNVETSHDSVYWENEAYYEYYKHGPLARTITGQQQVQGTDYAYTLHGWLKAVNPIFLSTGGSNGNGGNCDSSVAAVSDLIINARGNNAPAQYTARNSISFTDEFESTALDSFQTSINSSLVVCNDSTVNGLLDGSINSPVAKDAYSYILSYYNNDYTGINAISPSLFIPGQLGSDHRPLFNGNISSMAVNISKLNQPLLYNYRYDQLNRITAMDAWQSNNNFTSLSKVNDFAERIGYDANGNILSYLRNGNNTFAGRPLGMDSLTYNYAAGSNKLDHINDGVTAGNYSEDIDNQGSGNYSYDATGNLVSDNAAGINSIAWTVYGKIDSIMKQDGSTIKYLYDAAGNRINKTLLQNGIKTSTNYVRDASGNVLSVYTAADTVSSGHLLQSEVDLYGSSRLGIWKPGIDMDYSSPSTDTVLPGLISGHYLNFSRGNKFFELSNHLGNVLVTVSDKKIQHSTDGTTIDYYNADVVSANDYYPFGMQMPGRTYNSGNYRYGFNGKEKDPDMDGNNYDYGSRIYNPQIGRFLSVDPLEHEYPELTPYQFSGNSPIAFIDRDGEEMAFKMPDGTTYVQPPSDHLRTPIPQDVQRNGKLISGGNKDWSGESLMLDLTPGVGSLKGLVEGIAGYDMAGNKLSPLERWLGVLPYVSKVKKVKTILKIEKAAEKIEETEKALKASTKSEKVVESTEKSIVKSGRDATKNRVKPRKGTVEKVKENQPKNEKGELLDPYTGDVLDPKNMDLGHKPGEEWWRRKEMHKAKGSTRKEVIEAENNPDLYHYEERSANQDHSREKPKS